MALETIKIKRGATFDRGFMFPEDDWNSVYPWDTIEADVKHKGTSIADTIIEVVPEDRVIRVIAPTDTWLVGTAKMDIRIVKNEKVYLYPAEGVITIEVLETITDGSTYS